MNENINGLGYIPPDTVEDFADSPYYNDLSIPEPPKNGNGLFRILDSTKKIPRRGPGIFDIVNTKKTPRSKSIFSILDSTEKVKKVLPEANDIVPSVFEAESVPVVSAQDSIIDQSGMTLVDEPVPDPPAAPVNTVIPTDTDIVPIFEAESVPDPAYDQTVEEPLQSQINQANVSTGSTPMLLLIAAALAAYFFQNNSENNENNSFGS